MYYNTARIFSQFVVAPTGCINAMNLKIFPNTNMLLKVDCFERFSNINELVISNTNGCKVNDYKLNNNLG